MTKIMKGGVAYNATANMVALTQAEYNALSTAQKNNGNFYFITDADPSYFSAGNIDYNNTSSGLSATNIQGAIDELENEKADSSDVYTQAQVNTLLGNKLDDAVRVTTSNGNFPGLVKNGQVWLISVMRISVSTSLMMLVHNYNGTIYVREIAKDSGMAYLTNNQGTVTITYSGSGANVNGAAYRLY